MEILYKACNWISNRRRTEDKMFLENGVEHMVNLGINQLIWKTTTVEHKKEKLTLHRTNIFSEVTRSLCPEQETFFHES